MTEIKIKDEFIKLGQALKLAGLSENGTEAKMDIQEGSVRVNGEVELRRGRKSGGAYFCFGCPGKIPRRYRQRAHPSGAGR